MKKSSLLSFLFVLILVLFMSISAFAVDNDVILSATQKLVSGTDLYEGIDSFTTALNQLEGLTIQTGSRGNYVAAFQTLLIEHGYLSGKADGIFSKVTAAAVRKFQQSAGLETTGAATVATQFMMIVADSEIEENSNGVYIAQTNNYAFVVWPDYSFFIGLLEDDGSLDYGTYYFASGDYYVGDFEDDQRHGVGTAYFKNGDLYIGEWVNDDMCGKGIYYYGGIDTGEYYDGQWSNNMMNGTGTYVMASGQEVTGTWNDNQHEGW